MSHTDAVARAPEGFRVTAQTEASPVAAFEAPERGLYGVQFHPEVAHTPKGLDLLKNFLYEVCDARPTWTRVSIIEEAVRDIQERVGDERIICGLSGGVDSAVAAVLVHKAVGDQLTCVFVDHGLLRADEPEQVEDTFRRHFHINLIHVKAQDRFLGKLAGVTDPERKRRAIGEEFIRVFEEIAQDRARRRELPRPGHALPGHHRVGHARRRQDQEPPQRRRPPRGHGFRARRAAAQPLQGRGARDRRGARPPRGDRVAAAVPRARASRSGSSAR